MYGNANYTNKIQYSLTTTCLIQNPILLSVIFIKQKTKVPLDNQHGKTKTTKKEVIKKYSGNEGKLLKSSTPLSIIPKKSDYF
jgi:hypothetical protein